MNSLDLIVLAIIIAFIVYYYVRGFAVAVTSFLAFFLSFILARMFYPFIASFLRSSSGLFESLQGWVSRALGLDALSSQANALTLENLLYQLNLPSFVQNYLTNNNTAETRALLNVETADAFIAAFIAGAIINIAAMIIAFAIVFVLLRVFIHMIDLVTRLPVIKQVNKLFGALLGALIGTFFSWFLLTIVVWIFGSNQSFNINQLLEDSLLASALQNINIVARLAAIF